MRRKIDVECIFILYYYSLLYCFILDINNVKGVYMCIWFEFEIFKFVFRGGYYYWFIKIWILVIELRFRCFVKKKKSLSYICVVLV